MGILVMSEITDRAMKGGYISKAECLEHSEELTRLYDAYGPAMAAMEKAEALPPCKVCEGEYGYADNRCEACGSGPLCFHCLMRHEEECIA
jgi:hypothetical protein